MDHGCLTMSSHYHLLFSELLGNILGRASRHINPGLGEESAASEHEGDVEDGVDGVSQHRGQSLRRREVVAEAAHGVGAAAASVGPDAEQVDEEVAGELDAEHLGDHVEIGDEGRLENDGNIGGVEQFDGITAVLASVSCTLDGKIHPESLEVYHHTKDENCGKEIHQVGQVLSVESLSQGSNFVLSCCQKMEEGNHCSLKLGSTSSVDSSWRECLPDNGLTNVCGNEEGNTRSKTISLLEQFIQKQNNEASNKQLDDDEETDSGSNIAWISVHSCQNIDDGLANGDDHPKQFLGPVEQGSIFGRVSDLNQLGSGQELHDEARGHDGGDTQLHQGSSVRGQDNSDPVKWICRI